MHFLGLLPPAFRRFAFMESYEIKRQTKIPGDDGDYRLMLVRPMGGCLGSLFFVLLISG